MSKNQKNELIRAEISKLRKQGYQYRIFWTVAGMKDYNFYHFMSKETSLKDEEIKALEQFLLKVFNISI